MLFTFTPCPLPSLPFLSATSPALPEPHNATHSFQRGLSNMRFTLAVLGVFALLANAAPQSLGNSIGVRKACKLFAGHYPDQTFALDSSGHEISASKLSHMPRLALFDNEKKLPLHSTSRTRRVSSLRKMHSRLLSQ